MARPMRTPARMAVSSDVSPGIAPPLAAATLTGTVSTLFTAAERKMMWYLQ